MTQTPGVAFLDKQLIYYAVQSKPFMYTHGMRLNVVMDHEKCASRHIIYDKICTLHITI